MKCDEVQMLLPDYGRGKIGHDEGEEILAHLNQCATCNAEADEIMKAIQLIEGDMPWKPGGYYWDSLIVKVNEKIARKKERRYIGSIIRFAMPAAASAALLILLITLVKIPDQGVDERSSINISSVTASDLADYYIVESAVSGFGLGHYYDFTNGQSGDDEILKEIVETNKNEVVASYLDDDELFAMIDEGMEPQIVTALQK